MRRKHNTVYSITAGFLCLMLCLSGCGGVKQEELFCYKDSMDTITSDSSTDDSKKRLPLFSENLCVIPVSRENDNDASLTASSELLVNESANQVVYGNEVYKRIYPASITKLVTAYVTLKYGNLDDTVTISHEAANITESGAKKCGFLEGETITLRDLLGSFLVYSGNDAGIAIAEHVGGSVEKFADLMNTEMKQLGATGSHFVNPHGLHDEEHYTTAYDIYLVFHQLLQYEEFVQIISQPQYECKYYAADGSEKSQTFETTNRYLKGTEKMPDGVTVIGGKTGTTDAAGSCLAIYAKADDGTPYLAFVFQAQNGDDLFSQMSTLLNYINQSS